jgi:hypothetical protein
MMPANAPAIGGVAFLPFGSPRAFRAAARFRQSPDWLVVRPRGAYSRGAH